MIFAIDLDGTFASWESVPGNNAAGSDPFEVEVPVGDWLDGAQAAVRCACPSP